MISEKQSQYSANLKLNANNISSLGRSVGLGLSGSNLNNNSGRVVPVP